MLGNNSIISVVAVWHMVVSQNEIAAQQKEEKGQAVHPEESADRTLLPLFASENDVMRVWFLRVFVICGLLCFLKMLVVLKNVSSKNVDL